MTNLKKTAKNGYIQLIFRFSDGTEERVEGYDQLNLLAHGQLLERDLQSRCGGHGECGTCRVRILGGTVSSPSVEETQILKTRLSETPNWRLACQCFPVLPSDPKKTEVILVEVPRKTFPDRRTEPEAD